MARITELKLTVYEAQELAREMFAAASRQDNGCLVLPTKFRTGKGYARYPYKDEKYAAHRLIYIALNGTIASGRVVMHKCDNPPCIEPSHLLNGTINDNNQDKVNKGRQPYGEDAPGAKLSELQAKEIIRLVTEEGWSGRRAGRFFGIHHKSVQRLLAYEKWKHLKPKDQNS